MSFAHQKELFAKVVFLNIRVTCQRAVTNSYYEDKCGSSVLFISFSESTAPGRVFDSAPRPVFGGW